MKTSKKWFIASMVSLSASLVFMDNTIVTVLLSQLQTAFHANLDTINWVSSAYFLAEAAVIPIVGYLSDRFGSKVTFMTSLGVFTTASLLCSLSPTKEALIIFRVLQGLGGGALVPMVYGINYRLFPPTERAKVTGFLSIPILLAPALGPTIGGYLTTAFSWNAAFLINVPIGIVILILAFQLLPGRTSDGSGIPSQASKKNFDFLGLFLSAVGVTTLVYGISQVGSNSWSDAIVLVPVLIGVAMLIVFVVVELRMSDPVLDLRLFKNYTFTIANVLMWLIMGISTGAIFLLPLFFESVQGVTALGAGALLIGSGLSVGVGLSVSGVLYKRVGPRVLTVSGLLLLVGGTYVLTQLNPHTSGLDLQVWLFLRGIGIGLVFQPTQTLALSVVSNKGMARAASLVNVARQVATATAVAILTTYLTQQTATHAVEIGNALQTGLQTHNLAGFVANCPSTVNLDQVQGLQACVGQQALATGIADTYWLVLILGAISIPLALVMGRDPAIVAYKQKLAQAQVSNAEIASSVAGSPVAASSPVVAGSQIMGIPHVISTLTDSGEEVMGPDVLLWRYPKDKVVNGSLLYVGNNHFSILKSYGTILKVYDAGQHFVPNEHPLFSTTQLAFSGEPIPWQYEVLYINRAKLVVKASGVTLSREMAEVDYHVDYYIHVATQEDALQLAQHMPYRGHTLNIHDINAYAGPVIEEAVNQLLLITPLEQVNSTIQELSQLVHQRLQLFLSSYGITLDMVKVQALAPRDERMKELIALSAFGLSKQDAVNHYAAMMRNSNETRIIEQRKELEQNLYLIWQKTLDRYMDEIVALRTEFERTRANIGLLTGPQSAQLQQLSLAINNDLQANAPSLNITSLPNGHALSSNQHIVGNTGQFKAVLSPMDRGVPSVTEHEPSVGSRKGSSVLSHWKSVYQEVNQSSSDSNGDSPTQGRVPAHEPPERM